MRIGRYKILAELGRGGMGSVSLAVYVGSSGFSRLVAVKRMQRRAGGAADAKRFAKEARVASRVHHPNVVALLDVEEEEDGALALVMELVHGLALDVLWDRATLGGAAVPPRIAASIVRDVLLGLHAAHEATDEAGRPMGLVHRDVSPPNILVGVDGLSRVADFGIATARAYTRSTAVGRVRGKLGYIAPEQLLGGRLSRRTDVYAAAVVLWELLVGQRLFVGETDAEVLEAAARGAVLPPSLVEPSIPAALDEVVMRGLERDPRERFTTALEMAQALERAQEIAPASELTDWIVATGGDALAERTRLLSRFEEMSHVSDAPDVVPPPAGPATKDAPRLARGGRFWTRSERAGGASRPRALMVVMTGGFILTVTIALAFRGASSTEPPSPEAKTTSPARAIPEEQDVDLPFPELDSGAHPSPTSARPEYSSPRRRGPGTVVKRSTPPPRARCSPPWVLDSAGRKSFLVECLQRPR